MTPEFITVSVESLIPYARNSRTHSDEQVTKIAASIKEFGFLNPIIIDGDSGIIAGHGRVMAAKKLGLKDVPCIEAAHLTDAQKRAYVIADNRLALDAGWDNEMLKIELQELEGMLLVAVDGNEVLIASPAGEGKNATVTRNPDLVLIARQFVWMELFTQRIYAKLSPEFINQLDPEDQAIFTSLAQNS